jgi:hypothetical protein
MHSPVGDGSPYLDVSDGGLQRPAAVPAGGSADVARLRPSVSDPFHTVTDLRATM